MDIKSYIEEGVAAINRTKTVEECREVKRKYIAPLKEALKYLWDGKREQY